MTDDPTDNNTGATELLRSLHEQGLAWQRGWLGSGELESLRAAVGEAADGTAGSRRLLSQPACRALVPRLLGDDGLARCLPADPVVVQATLFEKSAGCNWLVSVHQDLSIPVVGPPAELPGWGGWSTKQGECFVQPPDALLAQMLAVRLHLDDCGDDDGPLEVLPGTHRLGRQTPERAAALKRAGPVQRCLARQGDALLMRPLLLHASSKSRGTSRRRVLHLLVGPRELPGDLRWAQAVGLQPEGVAAAS
ncbi:phytanoyl-CoA dioxygenase family protein [Ideonella azotifigens]|uniref:Phytanoyl-CoA dioxygenase n=1 Tax=Ideonella azotifigens TaxID=513160 RepID=A0ABN1KEI5_9BURK|nr:phytanoyl-CoA dioxygenase family protein [Ideonella azotifigens]MCD2340701.1 phytanoyl-CoA dioxygenase family protein [Ideonella azotifigens]